MGPLPREIPAGPRWPAAAEAVTLEARVARDGARRKRQRRRGNTMSRTSKSCMTSPFIIAASLALALIACAGEEATEGTAPEPAVEAAGEAVSEAVDVVTLPIEVRVALLEELGVDALRIDTTVDEGHVTLAGMVREPASQVHAEEIAGAVDGVESVRSSIVVAPSEDLAPDDPAAEELEKQLADELLEGEIKLRLYGAIGVGASDIEVESIDGTVTLRGVVDEQEEHGEAVAAAEAAAGVVEVIDLIEVTRPIV